MRTETRTAERDEACAMCQQTLDLMSLAWEGFRRQDVAPFETAAKLAREIHAREKALTAAGGELVFVPMHLERIADNVEALIGTVQEVLAEGVSFTDRALREVNGLFGKALELIECVRDGVITRNRILIRHVLEHGRHFSELADDFALAHQQRLVDGVCLPRASSSYLAMLDHLKGVESHLRQIAQKLAAGAGPPPA